MKLRRQLEDLRSRLKAVSFAHEGEHYALDRVAFAEEALGLELDPWQARVLTVPSKRDVLNCSRQAGKSTTAAVLALHEALYKPGSVTILVSPTLRQSSELFRKVVDLRERLPVAPTLLEDNKLSMDIQGGGRVVSLPGSEATVRGFSAVTLLIEDEASRVEDALFEATRPMLATTNGRHILMSTPWGKRGHFWEVWDQQPGWTKTRITVYDVPRIDRGWIEEERQNTPAMVFASEYMGEFVDSIDQVFGTEYVMGALTDDFTPFFGGSN
jgi:hypothetical protein